ncbi:MAG: hypothetical protein HRF43_14020 [Phycisphaerae bacterium]|jgi:hypothetical protein
MSSARPSETLLNCAGCGATIYPEHLDRHLAGYWAGSLYCSCCLAEKRDGKPAAPPAAESGLTLEEAPAEGQETPPPSAASGPVGHHHHHRLPPRPDAKGATRMRIFHSRLSEGAVGHLDMQINEWLERHPEIELKFAHTTVGTWEGKHAEPNLIITVFY